MKLINLVKRPVLACVVGGFALLTMAQAQTEYIGGFSPGGGFEWMAAAERRADFDAIRAADAAWIRLDVDWMYLQDAANIAPANWHWERYDAVIADARPSNARKLNVLVILHTVPGWANSNSGNYAPPHDLNHFKTFCCEVAKRYLPLGVVTFQIGNEVNTPKPGWFDQVGQGGPDGGSYYRYYLVPGHDGVSQAATELNKTFTMVLGSLAPEQWISDPAKRTSPHTFLVQVYDSAGGNAAGNQKHRWQAVAYHPYVDIGQLPANGLPSAHPNFRDVPGQLFADMSYYGDSAKKLWATEFGQPTSAAGSITEAQQAAWVDDAINRWYSYSYAGPLLWYSLRDREAYGGTDRESYFGVLRFDRTKKHSATLGAFARLKGRFRF